MNIDELQKRYDELTEIMDRLELTVNHIKIYKDFKKDLDIIRYEVQKELDKIEPELQKAYDEEEKAQNREYWATQF